MLDAADIGKLLPRWDRPLSVTACPGPNACAFALPSANRHCRQPFFERDGADPDPGPVSDVGQEGKHEVELLLNRTERRVGAAIRLRTRSRTRKSWFTARGKWRRMMLRPHAVGPPAMGYRATRRFPCLQLGPEPGWRCSGRAGPASFAVGLADRKHATSWGAGRAGRSSEDYNCFRSERRLL